MSAHGGDGWWVCWEKGCPVIGVKHHTLPPMTGREAFERHQRTNHSGRNQ